MTLRPWTALALAVLAITPAHAAPDIRQFTSVKLHTLTLNSEVSTENQAELQKIGGDFALAYRVHRLSMAYQQPGMLHFETTVLGRRIFYTINGNKRLTVAPFVHKLQDITGAPGKKQTLLDSGILPPEVMDDYNATYLRRDGGQYVFELMPREVSETSKDIIWFDPKTHITSRRQHYTRDGKLFATFVYKNAVQAAPGVYVPTRVEVYNTQNRLGGVTLYQNIRVNAPINPSLFSLS